MIIVFFTTASLFFMFLTMYWTALIEDETDFWFAIGAAFFTLFCSITLGTLLK